MGAQYQYIESVMLRALDNYRFAATPAERLRIHQEVNADIHMYMNNKIETAYNMFASCETTQEVIEAVFTLALDMGDSGVDGHYAETRKKIEAHATEKIASLMNRELEQLRVIARDQAQDLRDTNDKLRAPAMNHYAGSPLLNSNANVMIRPDIPIPDKGPMTPPRDPSYGSTQPKPVKDNPQA